MQTNIYNIWSPSLVYGHQTILSVWRMCNVRDSSAVIYLHEIKWSDKKQDQAGAELCQAQESLGLLGLDYIWAFFD